MRTRHRPGTRAPVIGLSANVVDPSLTNGEVDGIGVYTLAHEREFALLGVPTRRVYAPSVVGNRLVSPPSGELAFRLPVPAGIAATALVGVPIAGARRVESEIDLYHATDYLIPKLRRTPVVATVYDAIPLAHPEWARASLRRLKNWVLRSGVRRADIVIAISHAVVPEIVEHYRIPESRVRVIPLGIDAMWSEQPAATRVEETLAAYGLARGYFLFVGTLQPRKNVETALEAYDRLPRSVRGDRQLVIVGRFGWGVQALRAELERRKGQGRCIWLDYVGTDRLRDLYAGAGAFVFPSLAEGFGLPVLEALAAGLPVIASDLPVLREVAGSLAVYVPGGDSEAFSAAMQASAEREHTDREVSARRRHAVGFSWRTCAQRTADVYGELL